MPIYEYRCQDCCASCELLVRGGEQPLCPSCQSRRLEKLMSAPAVRASSGSLPLAGSCPPPDAPPCGPGCCRLPG